MAASSAKSMSASTARLNASAPCEGRRGLHRLFEAGPVPDPLAQDTKIDMAPTVLTTVGDANEERAWWLTSPARWPSVCIRQVDRAQVRWATVSRSNGIMCYGLSGQGASRCGGSIITPRELILVKCCRRSTAAQPRPDRRHRLQPTLSRLPRAVTQPDTDGNPATAAVRADSRCSREPSRLTIGTFMPEHPQGASGVLLPQGRRVQRQ